MRTPSFSLFVPLLASAACVDPSGPSDQLRLAGAPSIALTAQVSGTTNRLQSIAAVSDRVAWISGAGGTVLRTTDGGATWVPRPVAGAETLAFRDIHATSANVAWVLTNNGGASARIYRTVDGGATWTLHYQNPIPVAFYDCFAFWNPRQAVAVPDAEPRATGDAWGFDAIRMRDGATWENIADAFGPGVPGEGLFPTSGNCVTTLGPRRAYAVIAGADPSRVVITRDQGDTWTSYPIPIAGGPTAGGMNVRFRDRRHGMIGGGDVTGPSLAQDNFARSSDGGETWELATPTPFPGAIYGLAYIPAGHVGWHAAAGAEVDDAAVPLDDDAAAAPVDPLEADRERGPHHDGVGIIAAGPGGAAWSADEGDTWELVPGAGTGYFSVELASHRRGWLVGTGGQIVRIDLDD